MKIRGKVLLPVIVFNLTVILISFFLIRYQVQESLYQYYEEVVVKKSDILDYEIEEMKDSAWKTEVNKLKLLLIDGRYT